jgi:hypothetical protein
MEYDQAPAQPVHIPLLYVDAENWYSRVYVNQIPIAVDHSRYSWEVSRAS